MVMTDPIADMLTRIRNAQTARHESVIIPDSVATIGNRAFYGCSGLTSVTAITAVPLFAVVVNAVEALP